MAQRNKQINKWLGNALFMCIAFCLLQSACQSKNNTDMEELEQIGVSQALANYRKKTIDQLHYQLYFSIPENMADTVAGQVAIKFNQLNNTPVIIDFKADKNQVRAISVNNQIDTTYRFINEHIVISSEYLQKGENNINIDFIAGNQSLNRNQEFLYTLLVPDRARTLFPCFDQPNLKATYELTLKVPEAWVAISNTSVKEEKHNDQCKLIQFAPTEPLSTYLFSFVAGKFQKETRTHQGRTISAYYRETDPMKLKQFDTLFQQVFAALTWLEDYTSIPYPFAKYDFIILPGFQYGGMEHTGATLYNDRRMFLNEHPTPDEELRRSQLIAHETAHMWFGDYVTMDWFNDVWTKEVFANYFAALITEPLFPTINHDLNRLRTFNGAAMSEDRTRGTTSIQQPLSNLKDAGLIYGQIIYNKAPVMMQKLADLLGAEAFRTGIQLYLKKYGYNNATWDNLIEILDAQTHLDLKSFSQVWVKEKGMPTIVMEPSEKGFSVIQEDPFKRGCVWPQSFEVIALNKENCDTLEVTIDKEKQFYSLSFTPELVIPNTNGKGYGYFALDEQQLTYIAQHWSSFSTDITRQSLVVTLYENYLHKRIKDEAMLINSFMNGLNTETNPLIASSLINYLGSIYPHLSGSLRTQTEERMAQLGENYPTTSGRLQIQRQLYHGFVTPQLIQSYYQMWQTKRNPLWGENDYTALAYELALRMPEKEKEILNLQRSRISNVDRLQQFDFISRACTSDTLTLDTLFNSLLLAENRRIEPYASSMLYYLNHPLRDAYAVKYIQPGLKVLQEVQQTGDIFFPSNWVESLISPHREKAAYAEVERFLKEHPDYPALLKNKILQAVYPLERVQNE